jgi:hypothetical protein
MWIRKKINSYVYRWLLEEMASVTSDLCKESQNRFVDWPIIAVTNNVPCAVLSGLLLEMAGSARTIEELPQNREVLASHTDDSI